MNYAQPTRGERGMLTAAELDHLENQILPTARRWLSVHGLRQHAVQTLAYWGEDIPEEFRK